MVCVLGLSHKPGSESTNPHFNLENSPRAQFQALQQVVRAKQNNALMRQVPNYRSKNLWAIGYSGNLPCNSDVTSLKFLLPQVAFPLWRQQCSEVRPSLMQSPTLSNSCKCLMSLLNPSSDRLWRPYMTGTTFSCGYLLATVRACVSKLYHSSWTSSGVS